MTDDEYKAHVGMLCIDIDRNKYIYMIYDMYYKLNHKGGVFPAYKYICMNTGHMAEAPCSQFFDNAAYVRWLTPNS